MDGGRKRFSAPHPPHVSHRPISSHATQPQTANNRTANTHFPLRGEDVVAWIACSVLWWSLFRPIWSKGHHYMMGQAKYIKVSWLVILRSNQLHQTALKLTSPLPSAASLSWLRSATLPLIQRSIFRCRQCVKSHAPPHAPCGEQQGSCLNDMAPRVKECRTLQLLETLRALEMPSILKKGLEERSNPM